jgi:hypothetical protein
VKGWFAVLKRVYICHTYYHVYVSLLKELNNRHVRNGKADIVLSTVSTDFKNLKDRLEKSQVFNKVLVLNEKNDIELFGDELKNYRSGNLLVKLFNNIKYTRELATRLSVFIDIDFSKYNEIFVYVDGDPIGHYLNYKKIKYCAVEDGLDSLKYADYLFKQKFFGLKKVLARLGIIFMPYGFSKYAVTVEVNDKKSVYTPKRKTIELPRKMLADGLDDREKRLIYEIFMSEYSINNNMAINKKTALLVVQPLYPEVLGDIEQQLQLYKDLIDEYCKEFIVYIKPHPRDKLNYIQYFKKCIILERYFPIEVLNFSNLLHFDRAITVYSTAIDAIDFVDEKITVGKDFLEKYK